MLLAIRVEVDSLAAARDALPPFLDALTRLNASASFFINIGPDYAGKTRSKLFRIGENKQQVRNNLSLAGPHGLARLYGYLLPAPQLVSKAASQLLAIKTAGFETGLLAWDRVKWVQGIANADEAWVHTELQAGCDAIESLFGERPQGLALPRWGSSRVAMRLAQRLGFVYLSASRGTHPYLAVTDGEPVNLPQLPTSLPTLSELIGLAGRDEQGAADYLLHLTANIPPIGHVFNISLSADGGKRLPLLQQLFTAWREQGYELASLQQLHQHTHNHILPWHSTQQQSWPAYQGLLTTQGPAFPG
ncbi:polysaccharide deacetylase family protein [Chitinimonas sp. BJB300]|uniref:polysaccharide deacetylase family protein n=1 Tax=Chitinimonas sp. BJB300 TaxID=1559339 RepID=UPI000C0C65FD|nr:polysaccharide deacetylase family protein [Chitinimonas sp. BJB300]PHV13134.1 4-deoxy-4-formamido-L-arabinose-phosphoundecaprenol deformylase [Chitinimonas sp. BJB300]